MARKKAARNGGRRSGGSSSRRAGAQRKRSTAAKSGRQASSRRAAAGRKGAASQRRASSSRSGSSRDPSAIQLLKQDHREVEELFERFEDASESEKAQIARQVCAMLTVHAQIEEELIYPAAKQALEEDDDADLVDEATVEHASAKDLIAQIRSGESDELFEAKVKVLGEYVKHHVKEEEQELFPKLKQSELDLEALGAQLASRKAELASELGLEAGDGAADDDESDIESNMNPSRTAGSRGGRPSASRNA